MVEQEREARIQSEIERIRQLFREGSLETEEGETSLREALDRLEAVRAEWTALSVLFSGSFLQHF